MLSPEEIVSHKYLSTFEEALVLTLDFRYFYYRAYMNIEDSMAENANPVERGPHIDVQCAFWQSIADLTIKDQKPILNALENLPPAYNKSTIICYFVAWCLIREPKSSFLLISCGEKLSKKNAAITVKVLKSTWLKSIFQINATYTVADESLIIRNPGGSEKPTIFRGFDSKSITGFDGNQKSLKHFSGCVICDDPHSAGESDTVIQSRIKTFMEVTNGRIRNPETGFTVVAGQMVGINDLSNYIMTLYKDTVHRVCIPELNRFNLHSKGKNVLRMEFIKERNAAKSDPAMAKKFYLQHQQNPDYEALLYSGNASELLRIVPKLEFEHLIAMNDYQGWSVIKKSIVVDPSQLSKTGDPVGVCEFITLCDNSTGTFYYYLEKIHILEHRKFKKIDEENGLQPQTVYHNKIIPFVCDLIKASLDQGYNIPNQGIFPYPEIEFITETGGGGGAIHQGVQHQYQSNSSVVLHPPIVYGQGVKAKEVTPGSNAKSERFTKALNHFVNNDARRFFVVQQSETHQMGGREVNLIDVLKHQVAYIHKNKQHDEIVDCISMFLIIQQGLEFKQIRYNPVIQDAPDYNDEASYGGKDIWNEF